MRPPASRLAAALTLALLPTGAMAQAGADGTCARDVLVATRVPEGLSARNVLPGRLAALTGAGPALTAEIDCGGAILTARLTTASASDLGLAIGAPVYAVVKSVAFDPAAIGAGRRSVEI